MQDDLMESKFSISSNRQELTILEDSRYSKRYFV